MRISPHRFLYLEIAESIRRLIASGELRPGDRLEPVREMARRWNCTPGTVGRAYASLAKEGLIEGYRGGGTKVAQSTLQPDRPVWQWASLVNRAEQYLLAAISAGHSPEQAQAALQVATGRWRDLQQQSPPAPTAPCPPNCALRFVGSHDLLLESLTQLLTEAAGGFQLSVEYSGSLGGLMALAQGTADIAGTHLWDETTDSYNAPFVKRLLPGRRVALLTLAHRSLGLILPAGNPQGLQALADLSHPEVLLVNRQAGSGTRVWLDAQLNMLGLRPEAIPGYGREELTHLAVARAVADGEATVGLGIHAAADAYGLGFVPLAQERYDLAWLESTWHSPAGQTLIGLVRSDSFRQAVRELGGYETAETGREQWVA